VRTLALMNAMNCTWTEKESAEDAANHGAKEVWGAVFELGVLFAPLTSITKVDI